MKNLLAASVLKQRLFRITFVAQSLVELADQFLIVAVTWAVLSGNSGTALGLVLACWAVPRGVFLLLGGVLVDRLDRRVLAVGCGVALAVVICGLAALVLAGSVPLQVWVPVAVALGVLDGVRLPIGYSLIPLVVSKDDVLDANRWSQLRLWATLTLGPAGGGLCTGWLGAGGALLITGVLYLCGGLLLVRLPALGVDRDERTNMWQDVTAGVRAVVANEKLRILLPVFTAVNLFVLGITSVGIPLLVKHGLGGSATSLGLVTGSFGVGLMVGTAVMPAFPRRATATMVGLFCMFALSDGFLASTGLSNSVLVACLLFGLSGFFIGPASACYQAILQTSTPQEYLGRVTSMSRAASFGLEPLSASLVGVVSRAVSAASIVLVGGLAAMTIDLTAVLRGAAVDRVTAQPRSAPADEVAGSDTA